MAKKQREKLPKLEEIKKKIKGKVYVGNRNEEMDRKVKELEKQVDSLSEQNDSLQIENDSLKQVIKVRVK